MRQLDQETTATSDRNMIGQALIRSILSRNERDEANIRRRFDRYHI